MKKHYLILDGMRGVAALIVLGYHLFEAVAFAAGAPEQRMYHGFLAVDFFLVLSGFVMGYAYDDQWDRMSVKTFIKKRLIRLHPMVVMGVFIGLLAFLGQGCLKWDGTSAGWLNVVLTVLLSLFLLPSPLKVDVRGNTEMFPLNGPHWSLFFEYIGSLLYALLLRKLPTKYLKVWVVAAAAALFAYGIWGPDGSIACGWSSQPMNMLGGLLRMTFDYPMGLLLARLFNERNPKPLSGNIFWVVAAVMVAFLCIPSLGGLRVYYEMFCVAILFPVIVWFSARGEIANEKGSKAMSFLGGLSYPLYAVHYPFIYLYIGWISSGAHPFGPYEWCSPVAVTVISIAVAAVCMKFYDIPVRRWLTSKLNH